MKTGKRRYTAPSPRNPETAAELAPLVQKHAVKLMDKAMGEAADWPLIAEAMLLVAFKALDQIPNDPAALRILRRVHSGAESRLTTHPLFEPELYQPDTGRELLNTYGFDTAETPPGPKRSA